jgi:peptidoglycan/xylan/chitin deacetylase (PgdA/CDA1 family)
VTLEITPHCRFLLSELLADEVFHQWFAADARACRLSPTFRAYYQVRSLVPLRARQLLQRLRPVKASDRWCYPDEFFASLSDVLRDSSEGCEIVHPWPDAADFAFVLTHDVETGEGMRRVLQIADLEEEVGFRSSWNVVPYKYAIDQGIIRELQGRGFEIGVHGYNHDGKLFTSRRVFNRRVRYINEAMKAFGSVGFRAPMVHHNLDWMQALDVEYDASCFDADPYQAMPGGVGGVWPFVAGKFVELPYTLPQDHTLFVVLGEHTGRIWQEKLDYIVKRCGMALVITHPDYLDSPHRLDAYRQFLEHAASLPGMWHALPRDVATWWRQRDQSTVRDEDGQCRRIEGPASDRASAATLHFDAADGTRPRLRILSQSRIFGDIIPHGARR